VTPEIERLMLAQGALREDLRTITRYGEAHPDTWAGVEYDGPRLVALFTDPEPHVAALRGLVEHPDSLDVRSAPRSARELQALLARVNDIAAAHQGLFRFWGADNVRISVQLRGDAANLAASLAQEFGHVISIKLGGHDYPLDATKPPAAQTRGPVPSGNPPDLGLTALPKVESVRAGETVSGQLLITNRSDVPLKCSVGVLGQLLHADGTVAGQYFGPVTFGAPRLRLEPHGSQRIPFMTGTESVDPSVGAVLPPGRYDLVVSLGLVEHDDIEVRRSSLVSPTVPIDVLPAAPN
jgi:hypothetical protein